MSEYDVVVIGAGPGGYVAAIRAAQLGLTTVCVDRWCDAAGKPSPGGTCLNVGCIPSKALLDTSHHYHDLTHLFPAHGIGVEGASLDLAKVMARKDKVVSNLTRGVTGLLRKNKVELKTGTARLAGQRQLDREQHAVADGVSVRQGAVSGHGLEGVAQGVPQVEQAPAVRFPLVRRDHRHLDRHRRGHHRF